MGLSTITPPRVEDIIAELHTLMPQAEIKPDSDLIAAGFDSLRIMRFASSCRKAGFTVTFADLFAQPRPEAWVSLLHAASSTPNTSPKPLTPAKEAAKPLDSFRLAPLQHAYWAGGFDKDNLGGVSAHLYVELDGKDHDPDVIEKAVAQVVTRHDMLRVKILNDGTQKIEVDPPSEVFQVVDLRTSSTTFIAKTLESIRMEMSSQRVASDTGKMLDIRLTRLPEHKARLHVDFDMLAGDAMSYRIILDELAKIILGIDLSPLKTSFRQYLEAEEIKNPPHRERDQKWWQEKLPDLPDPPKLPINPNVTAHSVPPRRKHFHLTATQRAVLEKHARKNSVTPAACLATAFAEAIGAFAANPRFMLNVPLFHRESILEDIDKVVGDFSSSVLVPIDVSQQRSILEQIQSLTQSMHQSIEHSDWSALDVLRDLGKKRGTPVIAPIVYTSAVGLGELFSPRVREVFGDPVWILSEGPQVLLDAQVTELDGGFLTNWDVREKVFLPGVIDAMFSAYRANVLALLESPDWSGFFPDAVPQSQRDTRRQTETALTTNEDSLLHRRFFALAETQPTKPAVLWGISGERTYGELRDAALNVATSLRAAGVRNGDIVGVRVAKGPDQITALLGILAAGAGWVPVGADQPAARRREILAQSDARFVLHDETAMQDYDPGITGIVLSEALASAEHRKILDPTSQHPDDVAYVLFTSGSTGQPKGVEITHRAVMNTIDAVNMLVGLSDSDRTIGLSNLEFDLSIHDIFGPLNVGGAIVAVTDQQRRDADLWCELIAQHKVSQLYCVPPLLDMLLSSTSQANLSSLRWCLLGGDWVTLDLPPRLAQRVSGCRFAGLGGATETAIHSTFFEVRDPSDIDPLWGSVPFGVPLPNMHAKIVDEAGRDRPDFVPGEYLVSGPGIARGYRHDPELSSRKFPVINNNRWYRTNDMARYLPSGDIEFLGRIDDQVKIRGYRIEIGEIEAALRSAPGVENGVVVLTKSENQTPRLGAVLCLDSTASTTTVRDWLTTILPPYMIPEVLLPVADLPINNNGKHDRKVCSELLTQAHSDLSTAVESQLELGTLEKLLAEVFAEAIGISADSIGPNSDFIQLGGDSVLITKTVSILRDLLDFRDLPAMLLFTSRTPKSLAQALREIEPQSGLFDKTAEILHELESSESPQ